MKYIRTEDGIVLNPAPLNCGNYDFGTYMGEDARQSDTIEELCDELVVYNPSNDDEWSPKHFIWKNKRESLLQPKNYKDLKVYGAIWTDKGLIYVAKMNEKGELELL